MRILVTWDGSGHALAALASIAAQFRPGSIEHIEIAIAVWPESEIPRWEDIHERQLVADDLHRAAAEVANEEVSRLLAVVKPLSASVAWRLVSGDLVTNLFQAIEDSRADLLLIVAGTRDTSGIIATHLLQIVRDSPVTTLILRSPNKR
jgi:hypothetical protein